MMGSTVRWQVLYSHLVQHFVACMGASPPDVASSDALMRQLAELTPRVPFYAASVFRAWISQMNERLVADLAAARDMDDAPVSGGGPTNGWGLGFRV